MWAWNRLFRLETFCIKLNPLITILTRTGYIIVHTSFPCERKGNGANLIHPNEAPERKPEKKCTKPRQLAREWHRSLRWKFSQDFVRLCRYANCLCSGHLSIRFGV